LDRNSNTGSAGFLYHQDKHLDDQKQSEGKINLLAYPEFRWWSRALFENSEKQCVFRWKSTLTYFRNL